MAEVFGQVSACAIRSAHRADRSRDVIYDGLSGDAHCLSPLAAVVFAGSDGRTSLADLAAIASSRLGESVDVELVEHALASSRSVVCWSRRRATTASPGVTSSARPPWPGPPRWPPRWFCPGPRSPLPPTEAVLTARTGGCTSSASIRQMIVRRPIQATRTRASMTPVRSPANSPKHSRRTAMHKANQASMGAV